MELLRLGLGEPAEHELRKLGADRRRDDKKRVDDPDQIEKLWAIAFLYDRAGRYATSHWPTRWHILDYRAAVAGRREPRALADRVPEGVLGAARRATPRSNHVPIAMQIAIVREESGSIRSTRATRTRSA